MYVPKITGLRTLCMSELDRQMVPEKSYLPVIRSTSITATTPEPPTRCQAYGARSMYRKGRWGPGITYIVSTGNRGGLHSS